MNNSLNLSSHRKEEPEKSVLYVVSTPIGNLEDISIRAINILKKVSLIACEDTRITTRLLNNYKISNKIISFHKYNFKEKIPYLIAKLKDGASIALETSRGNLTLAMSLGIILIFIALILNSLALIINGLSSKYSYD